MYNKLFTKILDSSIWLENQPTRIVWVTFIACMDQDGVVALSSIGNVANRARVSMEEATEAIRCLESPDEHNPDQDHDGRRIERIPGLGWSVLNAQKYRDIVTAETVRAQNRERQRRHRSRPNNDDETDGHAPVTHGHENVTPSEAEAEAEAEKEKDISIDISKKKNTPAKPKLTDDEWLDTLASNDLYKGIDVRREYGKASLWCETNSRQCTRKFFVNWINRVTPMAPATNGNGKPKDIPPEKDMLSPDYVMEPARLSFFEVGDSFLNHPRYDGTREAYEFTKGEWLKGRSAKGFEHEIEEYERTDRFRQRFGEARA